jgi:hypothetical protein
MQLYSGNSIDVKEPKKLNDGEIQHGTGSHYRMQIPIAD